MNLHSVPELISTPFGKGSSRAARVRVYDVEYREFHKRKQDEQREYWKWRHSHPD